MLLTDFTDDVRRDLPGAPDFVVLDAIQWACMEFFRDSCAYRFTSDPISFSSGVFEYTIDVPSGTQICHVEKIRRSDLAHLYPCTELDFSKLDPTCTGSDPTSYSIREQDETVMWWPKPDSTTSTSFIAIVILTTTREATQIPNTLGDRWRRAIVAGAQSYALSTRGKPWSDDARSSLRRSEFDDYKLKARRESVSGQFVTPLRVRMRKV